jgi:hypothetical protein
MGIGDKIRFQLFVAGFFLLSLSPACSQENNKSQSFAEFTAAAGKYRGSISLAFYHDWHIGKRKKASVGLGARLTGFTGSNLYYITAPAQLTSDSKGPAVLFKENIPENIDSLLISSPQVNAMNMVINLSYQLTRKFTLGFNIDAFGFSFGGKTRGNYINGIEGKITNATPTSLNLLLVSDNDKGSLNSELYGKYFFHEKWSFKLAAQFLFTEYTTENKVQQYPEENDRFRNKALLASAGLCYKF